MFRVSSLPAQRIQQVMEVEMDEELGGVKQGECGTAKGSAGVQQILPE